MTDRLTPRSGARPPEAAIRRLHAFSELSDFELDLLRGLGDRRERRSPGEELALESREATRPQFIVAGWACRERVLADGRRQIINVLLPGDSIGLARHPGGGELAAVRAITLLETVDASRVADAVHAGRAPGIAAALEVAESLEQLQLLDHLVRLGRQTAYERVAHFLLELQRRLEMTGLGGRQRFPMPLTQEVLADALGLSIVHVNRTLQQLRREGLIELRSGVALLLKPERLADIADCAADHLRPAAPLRPPAEGPGAAPAA